MRAIRKLVVSEGLSNSQLSERLNIPQRSVERYLSQLYRDDNQLLSSLNGGSQEHLLSQSQVKRDRLNVYRQEILERICRNPQVPPIVQLKGFHLVAELEAADLRLLDNCIALVARSSPLPEIRRVLLLKQQEEKKEKEEREFEMKKPTTTMPPYREEEEKQR